MSVLKASLRTYQMIAIAIVLIFVLLSSFDCIRIYNTSTGHSQTAILEPENIRGPTVKDNSYNNELLHVAIIGGIEIILIIAACFKLSIVTAVLELLISIGTLCVGYIERLLVAVYVSGPVRNTVSFEITVIGYLVVAFAVANLVMTILLQIKKKMILKGKSENATNDSTDWAEST